MKPKFLITMVLLCASAEANGVTIPTVPVGNVGNSPDTTGRGAVAYSYRIGTTEVTNAQYVEFLNAKDPTGVNTLELYRSKMSTAADGGIDFDSGAASGAKYSAKPDKGNYPVSQASWFNAIRFVNWLNNGQDDADTESGSYTLSGVLGDGASITRNPEAIVALPSLDEWYKAAYYDATTASYYRYPTSSNSAPTAAAPTAAANSANYWNAVGNLTEVGAYSGTTSPYGAFDMGGNVVEWNEHLSVFFRGTRGGNFVSDSSGLVSPNNFVNSPNGSFSGLDGVGFRIAIVPEPSTYALAAIGVIGLLAFGAYPRTERQRWTVPFCSQGTAKLGQSPSVLG